MATGSTRLRTTSSGRHGDVLRLTRLAVAHQEQGEIVPLPLKRDKHIIIVMITRIIAITIYKNIAIEIAIRANYNNKETAKRGESSSRLSSSMFATCACLLQCSARAFLNSSWSRQPSWFLSRSLKASSPPTYSPKRALNEEQTAIKPHQNSIYVALPVYNYTYIIICYRYVIYVIHTVSYSYVS